jgi:pimeloyl-ACP methyl ester carboxylesterase
MKENRLIGLLACIALASFAGTAGAAPTTIKVGQFTLLLCNSDYTGYCGALELPLDPTGAVHGTVTVGFEYYPRRDNAHASLGVILPQEGGPGYSSTGSRDFYLGLFDPLRDHRDILIIDKRGTGYSDAIDCPALQAGSIAQGAVAACASHLGSAAWLYGTAFASGDLVAVLDALDIDRVDFYGDSYGTFVGQVFAALYPQRVRSIVLDSAYPVRAPDAWFPTDWATTWAALDLSCKRSPSCTALGGSASSRMQALIDAVRSKPISGQAPDGFGKMQPTTVDTGALIRLIDAGGDVYGATIYRDIDAASRAWLNDHDAQPILRMVAENETPDDSDPADFSYGLYTAVICQDYPLLYDMKASASVRASQYASALNKARVQRADLFAPFTIDEALDSQLYYTPLDTCLPWPAPPKGIVPGVPLQPKVQFPAVPTLVLSGDLDSVTSPADAQQVTDQFPNARHVVVPNLTHVVAGGDLVGCASSIVLQFVQNLSVGDTRCTAKVRPVRTLPRFARYAKNLAPIVAVTGNKASDGQRRIAAAALETAGDVVAQWYATWGTKLRGMRNGTFSYVGTANGYQFTLHNDRWTQDVAVSGTVSWNINTNVVTAAITFISDAGSSGTLNLRWNDANVNAIATIQGKIDGVAVMGQRIAP